MSSTPEPLRDHAAPPARADAVVEDDAARGQSGVVYVEFLLAFIPVFTLMLGLIQMALLYTAQFVVQHAANVAARAAVVVLPDDPARYGGAPLDQLVGGRCAPSGAVEALVARVGRGAAPGVAALDGCGSGGGGPGGAYAGRNGRMVAIHDAASLALLSVAPSIQQVDPAGAGRVASVLGAIGEDDPAARLATGALMYNRAAMAVTFPTAPGASSFRAEFAREAAVTARVTFLFHCAIPIARMMMCRRRREVAPAAAGELSAAPAGSLLNDASADGQRFVALRAEATLALQGATRAYR